MTKKYYTFAICFYVSFKKCLVMKKYFIFLMMALLLSMVGNAQKQVSFRNRAEGALFEVNPEQWHRMYEENVLGKHYTEPQSNRDNDNLLFFMQNNKLSIRNDEDWYEPDTIMMFTPNWESRDIITYNEHGFKSTIIYQNMSYGIDTELTTYGRSVYTYNADNRILSITDQVLLENETWGNFQMFTYTYDFHGNLTSYLLQYWNGQNWANYYRIISDYDNRSNLLSRYLQLWEENNWVYFEGYYTYTYDANNNKLSELIQYWNGNQLINNKLSTYTYNESSYNDTIVNQVWNGGENIWINNDRFIYLYDNRGNKKESFHDYWQNDVWLNHQNTIYEYDANNNMLSFIIIFWQGCIWVNECQYIYTYDSLNNVLSQTRLQFDKTNNVWKNWERDIHTYNESNYLLSSTYQDGSGDEWKNRSRVIHEYDDDNNKFSTLGQWWKNNTWEDAEWYEYKYDEYGNCLSGDLWKWKNNNWVVGYADELEITYNHGQCLIGGEYYCHTISASYIKTLKPVIDIEEMEKEETKILVYPNPTTGQLRITNYGLRITGIEIFDLLGKCVAIITSPPSGGLGGADISVLPTGMYFVRITTENGVVTRKIIKN
jgi:hypothetical protein